MADAVSVQRTIDLAAKITLAVLALLTVRCAVRIALLQEEPDPAGGESVLCVHCLKVVPDEPFCVACGAAARRLRGPRDGSAANHHPRVANPSASQQLSDTRRCRLRKFDQHRIPVRNPQRHSRENTGRRCLISPCRSSDGPRTHGPGFRTHRRKPPAARRQKEGTSTDLAAPLRFASRWP